MRNLDLAWAAGFFDGEGTAYAKKNGAYSYLYLGLSQRDSRPMKRWVDIVQCGKVYKKNSTTSGKEFNDWMCWGDAVDILLNELWPYLSEPKKEQICQAHLKTGKGGSCGS